MTERQRYYFFFISILLILLSGCYSSLPYYSYQLTPREWRPNGYYVENKIIDDFKLGFILTHSLDSSNGKYSFAPAFEVITKYNIERRHPIPSSSFRFSDVCLINDSLNLNIPLRIDTVLEINRNFEGYHIIMDSVCFSEFYLDKIPTKFDLQYTITIIDNTYVRESYSQTHSCQIYPLNQFDHTKQWTTRNKVSSPFSPTTMFSFTLSTQASVTVDIYNLAGEHIRSIVTDTLSPDKHSIEWDAKDNNGESIASGIYFYKIILPDTTISKKMVMLK